MKYLFTKHRFFRHLPILPFIYSAGILLLFLDLWVEIYHRIAFPLYRIPYVRRNEYIKLDRHRLKYLNPMQKFNCLYCGYANGAIAYMQKIIAETEAYWCAIQHKKNETFINPPHHENFLPYNDETSFIRAYESKKKKML